MRSAGSLFTRTVIRSAPGRVVMRATGRRALRSGAGWGAVFGAFVATSALGYASAYPSADSRGQLALALGSNPGLSALLGRADQIDTVAGFTAWRCVGVLSIVGAMWGVLTSTRLLRGEEDAGRWELLLTGQTTRVRATAQGLVGLAAGWLALLSITAIVATASGRGVAPPFTVGAAFFLAATLTASSAMFLGVGALAAQLAPTRRQAASLAGGVLGLSVGVRVIADSGSLGWLRWLSPLGWVEELHPMTDPRPIALLPIVVLIVTLTVLTLYLAAGRDVGAGILPARDSAPGRRLLVGGSGGLALRLMRPAAIGWTVSLAAVGLLLGLVARSAAGATAGSTTVQQVIERLGASRVDAQGYLGVAFLFVVTAVSLVAAGQVVGAREEEAAGRLDNLLAQPVARSRWLVSRMTASAALVALCGAVAGAFAWLGAALEGLSLSLPHLLEAGLNSLPPALFVLGFGTLVHAVAPRRTAVAVYGIVAWSLLAELVGSVIGVSGWILDTSLLHHVAPVPAVDPDWGAGMGLVGLALVAAAAAVAAFTRRDVIGA